VRFVWAYIVGGFFLSVSVRLPLFLIARELRMGASDGRRLHAVDTILLAVALGGLTVWVDMR
jgi:hypothetical protein